jgi:hypothetical protein
MSEQPETEIRVLHPDDIIVSDALRDVDEGAVKRIIESFHVNGGRMIQPIVVDINQVLVDGGHRLEAVKREGWQAIAVVVDHTVTSKADRELQGLIANNVRHAMNPLDAARVYKQTIEPILKANRGQARHDGYQLRDSGVPSAAAAEGRSDARLAVPIAEDGRSRSSVPLVTGFSESKINEAFQLQEWAADESVAPEVRKTATTAIEKVRKTPGALHSVFLRVDALQHLTSLPPEQRPKMPTAEERAKKTLDTKLAQALLRVVKAVGGVDELFKAGDFVLWQGQAHHAAAFYAQAQALASIARYLDPKHTVGVNPDDDR